MNFSFLKKQRPPSVLGLALGGSQLEAVVLRRNNGSLRVQQTATAALALSPLSGDPELVGREIRNHLDQAGHPRTPLRGLSIPSGWLLMLHVKLPDLPEADVASYLQIEAERGFPSGSENLYIVNSRYQLANGEKYATLLGVLRSNLETLEKVLKAAQLKPVTFSPGAAAMDFPEKDSAEGALALVLGNQSLDLMVIAGGGIAVLRSLDAAMENEGQRKALMPIWWRANCASRWGSCRPRWRKRPGPCGYLAAWKRQRRFAGEIASRAEAMGLKVQVMDRSSAAQFDPPLSPDLAASPALALAANWLKAAAPMPELLPPKVNPWQQLLSGKQASKKLAWAGGVAGQRWSCVWWRFSIRAGKSRDWNHDGKKWSKK